MAGSWNHTVDTETGKLLAPVDLLGMLECSSGDVFEYAEEAYGMVWYLATALSLCSGGSISAQALIEEARQHYKEGLELSPGRAEEGILEDAWDDEPEKFIPSEGQWIVFDNLGYERLGRVLNCIMRPPYEVFRVHPWGTRIGRLAKNPESWSRRFMRPATNEDLNRFRVPEEERYGNL